MKKSISIRIPEPCHEKWHEMSPTEKGRFCQVCTKEVVDFSHKSDEQIIKYADQNDNLCGRFHSSQLDRKLTLNRKERNGFLSYAASLLLPITLLFSNESFSQGKPTKVEQTEKDYRSIGVGRYAQTKVNDSIVVSGTIMDKEENLPLPGANVVIRGKSVGVQTDFDGNYTINAQVGDTIEVSYLGFATQSFVIEENSTNISCSLKYDDMLMGETVMIGMITSIDHGQYPFTWPKYHFTHEQVAKLEERKRRVNNYFAHKRMQWEERRAERKAKRAARKAKKNRK